MTPELFSTDWWAAFLLSPTFAATLWTLATAIVTFVVLLRWRWDKKRDRERDRR